ncbi:hypothetical protein ACFTWF_24695 [Rhodococcus sp. NPDC056960]|uniref:hypothetical protein n=1 Tax=Rhodococcus sp. NPDC056960 TaxID=3345982 RepID=UPI0036432275
MAIVALDVGPWLYAWIVGEAPMRHGRVALRRKDRGDRLPVFGVCVSDGVGGGGGSEVSAVRVADAA